jgi:hypothetical protein
MHHCVDEGEREIEKFIGVVIVFVGVGGHYGEMLAGCWSVVGGGKLADKRSSGFPGPCTVLSSPLHSCSLHSFSPLHHV